MPKKFNKVALYMRLSKDDERCGESMSIDNQRIILKKFVADNNGIIVDEYIDDGWSGTNFDRPAITRLLDDAKSGRIDTIVVKDLSRFGRNYIQVGQYIDYIFPAYGIRFIALNDNIDTADKNSSGMDMLPIMNVFNEWHAANTSKKIRAVLEAKQRAGIYTSSVYPYGYRVGTDGNRRAVIDESAAKVVRRIFDLRIQGKSTTQIARLLTDEGIPNPKSHYTRLNGKKIDKKFSPFWSPKTVRDILNDSTYIGNLTQHKTTTVSYKNHKRLQIAENDRIVIENAHEAIISRETWDSVRAYDSGRTNGRVDKNGKVHLLSGLLVCPDCGKRIRLTSYGENASPYYVCRTYKDLGKKYCTAHSICENTINNLVLRDIQSMLGTVKFDEEKARARFLRDSAKHNSENRIADEKQLAACKSRLAELDKLIISAFEAKVIKGMPENVCVNLCAQYQNEKELVESQISRIEQRIHKEKNAEKAAEDYVKKLKSYLKCESLTREMCLELISRILLGEKTEQGRLIRIYYRFNCN